MPTGADTVWAVATGEYSDYHILFICRTEVEAENWISRREELAKESGCYSTYDHYFAEEFSLRENPMPFVNWRASGETAEGLDAIEIRAEITKDPPPSRAEATQFERNWKEPADWIVSAECSDRDAAIKSVKDRLAALIVDPASADRV